MKIDKIYSKCAIYKFILRLKTTRKKLPCFTISHWSEMNTYVMKILRECCLSIDVFLHAILRSCECRFKILLLTYNKAEEKTFIESRNCKDEVQLS